MTDKSKKTTSSKELDHLIQNASEKLHIDIKWARKIKPEDLIWLLDHCPFLQMVNTGITQEHQQLQFIQARSNWIIHDYGDAMSSSPGKWLLSGGDFRILLADEDDKGGEGGGGSILNAGKGTIRNQAYTTAMQMVEIAFQRGWAGIRFVDGHPMMERAAWIKAEELGMTVQGFKPSKYDRQVRDRVRMSATELEELRRSLRATPEATKKQPR